MKIINKLKSNNGSALMLAIILMLLVSIVAVMFSSQIANGVNRTSKNYEDLKIKYALEAGVEKSIGQITNQIQKEYKSGSWRTSYKNIVNNPPTNYKSTTSVSKTIDSIVNKSFEDNILGYIRNEFAINMDINMTKYIHDESGNNDSHVITSAKIKPIDIITTKKYKGKDYSVIANVEFIIADLQTGEVQYTINSWK